MTRVLNWDCLAVEWAIQQVGKPFVWGETDCCSLLNRMWEVMYGEPMFDLTYTSLPEALRFSAHIGGVRHALTEMGCTTLPLSYASTGDAIVADDEPFPTVLSVINDQALLSDDDKPVRLVPLSSVAPTVTVYRLG